MITLDTEIISIQHQQGDVIKVYQGADELWPGSPVNSQGFLKYDLYNIKREFKSPFLIDPNAPWDQTLPSDLRNQFQGPDTGIDKKEYLFDQKLWYTPGNIPQEFNGFPATGLYDQDLDYNITNLSTVFADPFDDHLGAFDYVGNYGSHNISTYFLGPDTGKEPKNYLFDQSLWYTSSNIPSDFNAIPPTGEFDQLVTYDLNNISTEFKNPSGIIGNGEFDYVGNYGSHNISTYFLGPDAGKNPQSYLFDQDLWYTSSNIPQEFNSFPATGVTDQGLWYDLSNISTKFISTASVGDPTAPWDQTLNSHFSTDFLGPDAGDNYKTYIKDQELWYTSNNMTSSFVGPGSTGHYDQNLVYSVSSIANSFRP